MIPNVRELAAFPGANRAITLLFSLASSDYSRAGVVANRVSRASNHFVFIVLRRTLGLAQEPRRGRVLSHSRLPRAIPVHWPKPTLGGPFPRLYHPETPDSTAHSSPVFGSRSGETARISYFLLIVYGDRCCFPKIFLPEKSCPQDIADNVDDAISFILSALRLNFGAGFSSSLSSLGRTSRRGRRVLFVRSRRLIGCDSPSKRRCSGRPGNCGSNAAVF